MSDTVTLRVEYGQLENLFGHGGRLKCFSNALSNYWSVGWAIQEDPINETIRAALSSSAYLLGLGNVDIAELENYFPHHETQRMFYATRVKCETLHINYNAHLVLHTEPSRWLRLSYLLGCTPSQPKISSTLVSWQHAEGKAFDTEGCGFADLSEMNATSFLERIMRDAHSYSDWLNDHAGEYNLELGLSLLNKRDKALYSEREKADERRFTAFLEGCRDLVW
jgi:hypothetical protein